jgi:hypothetical protein
MRFIVAVACLVGSVAPALPAADHLKCYKVREVTGPGRFETTRTLVSGVGLATETGCFVKGPARLLCSPVEETPRPPGGPTGATTRFICYKLRCPRLPDENVVAKDQFGTHVFVTKGPRTLCTPASPSGAFLDPSSAL